MPQPAEPGFFPFKGLGREMTGTQMSELCCCWLQKGAAELTTACPSIWGGSGSLEDASAGLPVHQEYLKTIGTHFWFHDHKAEVGHNILKNISDTQEILQGGVCRIPAPQMLRQAVLSPPNPILKLPFPYPHKHLVQFPNF